jgi:predicted nucleotidyltransferase component of viral defense system
MFVGSQGRFSTDLDFTGIEEHDHQDMILEMMGGVRAVVSRNPVRDSR